MSYLTARGYYAEETDPLRPSHTEMTTMPQSAKNSKITVAMNQALNNLWAAYLNCQSLNSDDTPEGDALQTAILEVRLLQKNGQQKAGEDKDEEDAQATTDRNAILACLVLSNEVHACKMKLPISLRSAADKAEEAIMASSLYAQSHRIHAQDSKNKQRSK